MIFMGWASHAFIETDHTMSTQKTIFGFLGGIALGATLGLLFAPASGKETRKKLRRRAESAGEDMNDLIEHGRAEWSKARNKAANAATDEVQDFVRYMMEEGRDLKARIKNDVRETASEVAANGKRSVDEARKAN
jgi:gas vesicle protein